jgi:hypothetical protein
MTGTPQYWLIETNHFHNLPGNEVCKEDSLGMRSEKNRSSICQLKKNINRWRIVQYQEYWLSGKFLRLGYVLSLNVAKGDRL